MYSGGMREWLKQKTQDWAFKKFLDGIYWSLGASSLSGATTGAIAYMQHLPIAAIIAYVVIVVDGTMAFILLFLELREKTGESAKKKRRFKAIDSGADYIFEDKDALDVDNISKLCGSMYLAKRGHPTWPTAFS